MDINEIEKNISEEYFASRKMLEKIYLTRDTELHRKFSEHISAGLKLQSEALAGSGQTSWGMVLFLFWCTPAVIIDAARSCGITLE